MLREALKISSPLALISREVLRFHGRSLWHTTPGMQSCTVRVVYIPVESWCTKG